MSDFVNFKLAQKLKAKGFDCKYPFAMYDEDGDFYPLFTSCDEDEDSNCIFGKRMYYGYDDFIGDKDAVIAPTISQVLKWLREEKEFMVFPVYSTNISRWYCSIVNADSLDTYKLSLSDSYEQAALAGIDYSLDNLI